MNTSKVLASAIAVALATSVASVSAKESNSVGEMFTDGETKIDFRYRYEAVDQASFEEDAKASTLRSRISFATGRLLGFSAFVEGANVFAVGDDDYNSTENGNGQYPVVADPEGTVLNQAYIRYNLDSIDARVGRQAMNYGSQRFVGAVGWRQNDQTYDGGRIALKLGEAITLDYAYVTKINRIFGPDDGANPAELDGDNHFFRADWALSKSINLAGFYYSTDIDPQNGYLAGKTVNLSSQTTGAEAELKFGDLTTTFRAAEQTDAGNSLLNYTADYYFLGANYKMNNLVLGAGYEVLGSDNGVGFSTPFATLHKFNGWADMFLATPGDGLTDAYVSAAYKMDWAKVVVAYHDFSADKGGDSYGKEFDAMLAIPLNKTFDIGFKVADFQSDSAKPDTQKFWFTFSAKL